MREQPAELFALATELVADRVGDDEAVNALAEAAEWSASALLGAYGVAESLVRIRPLDTGAQRAGALLLVAARRAIRPTARIVDLTDPGTPAQPMPPAPAPSKPAPATLV